MTARSTTTPGWGFIVPLLIVAGIFDWSFYQVDAPGWVWGLATLSLTLLLSLGARRRNARTAALMLQLLMLPLAVSMFLEPGVIAVLLSCLGITLLAVTRRYGWSTQPTRVAQLLLRFPTQAVYDLRTHSRSIGCDTLLSGMKKIVVGWAAPLVLSAGFLLLFAFANPIVQHWLNVTLRTIDDAAFWVMEFLSFPRIIFWSIALASIWALLRGKIKARYHVTVSPLHRDMFSLSVLIRCLTLFNIVFLLQNGLDCWYLLLGAELPQGMSYASYAHRGAYPLVATALLCAGFTLLSFRPGGFAERSHVCRLLVFTWIAQNIFLLSTSVLRLELYISVYGLTRLRCAALVWMGLVAMGLALTLIRIYSRKSNAWLLHANLIGLTSVLYVSSFINFDSNIAWFNIRNSKQVTGSSGIDLDLRYLAHLGPATLPALHCYRRQPGTATHQAILTQIITDHERTLRRMLRQPQGWTIHRSSLTSSAPTPPENCLQ